MKKHEIEVGKVYEAKVNGRVARVRVEATRETNPLGSLTNRHGRVKPPVTVYDVVNLETGRRTTFRSAAKFRRRAPTQE
jgi:hypothetical protein